VFRDPQLVFDGDPRFAALEARLRANPFYRGPSAEEVGASFAAYRRGDFAGLCRVWSQVAEPTRANLPGPAGLAYDGAHLAPRAANAYSFVACLRAALRAGDRFRGRLSPKVQTVLRSDFPWLDRRHEHVPDGWAPIFDFPVEFAQWIDCGPPFGGDDMRARWQLATTLNEVQQAHYSDHAAARFRLPELRRHAERSRQMAINYFSHWAPGASEALWRQSLTMLDGINAALFRMVCEDRRSEVIARSLVGAVTHAHEWRAFVAAMNRPVPLRAVV
jgi:hypothetical protein